MTEATCAALIRLAWPAWGDSNSMTIAGLSNGTLLDSMSRPIDMLRHVT